MRVRCRFTKLGKVRFTSHRDVARLWERALRKAQIPVAMTGGFSPRPRISFGLALPTGAESIAEYLDIELADGFRLEPDDLAERLTDALPPGFTVSRVVELVGPVASLQEDVVATRWEVSFLGVVAGRLEREMARVLASSSVLLERERKGERRVDDVRPAIEHLSVLEPGVDGRPRGSAVLVASGRALRPTELVHVLVPELDPLEVTDRVLRTHQLIERDGTREELLPLDAPDAPAPAPAVCV